MKKTVIFAICAILLVGSALAFTQSESPHPPPEIQTMDNTVENQTFSYSDERTKCIDPAGEHCITAAICDQTQEAVIISGVNGSSNMAVWWDDSGKPIAFWNDYEPGQEVSFKTHGSTILFKRGTGEYMPLHIYLELQDMWYEAQSEKALAQTQLNKARYEGAYDPGWDFIYELSIEQRNSLDRYIDEAIEEALEEAELN
jgi:hypothetical protein